MLAVIIGTTFILGFAFPPLWIITAWASYVKWRPKKLSRAEAQAYQFSRRPCPRCANDNVHMYNQGGWDYFTCMDCGARGWYPFKSQWQRDARLGSLGKLKV